MATAAINYQLQPGETIAAYNARIASAQGAQNGTPPTVNPNPPIGTNTTAPSSQNSDFITQLQNQLLGQSSIISSSNSNLENSINTAISGVNTANQDSNQAVTLNYNQQEAAAQQTGTNNLTSAQEAQQGFATNTTLLKQIQDTTTKNVNDLESQKQQLILQGNSQAATQISTMQMQAIQYQQQAQQQTFSNLLSMANFGLQANAQQQSAAQFQQTYNQNQQQQNFAQQQAISTIALQYGLQVKPGDTLASITTAAMPYASKAEQLQLQQIQSQIAVNNANAQKAISDAASATDPTADDITTLANAYNSGGQAVLGNIKDPNVQAQVIVEAGKLEFAATAQNDVANGVSQSDAQQAVMQNTNMTASQQASALQAIASAYSNAPAATAAPAKTGLGFTPGSFINSSTSSPGAVKTGTASPQATATLDAILKQTQAGFGLK